MKLTFILCFLCLIGMYVVISSVGAEAPTTPKILFTSFRDGNNEIYIMDPDGRNQNNLTDNPANDIQGVWSPTGEQILFVSNRHAGVWDLFLMDPDGTNVQKVFKKLIYREQPEWAPDGKRIVYRRAEENMLYIAEVGGQVEEPLVTTRPFGGYPRWSPDGTEIAFMSRKADEIKGYHIRIINVHARGKRWLMPKMEPSQYFPAWSPTGEKLAFSWKNAELAAETLFIVNRDGSSLEKVQPSAYDPTWSPQGDELLFKRAQQIYKIRIGDNEPKRLTFHIETWFMDWFDPAYALPVSPQPHLLTTTWGEIKKK